MERVRLKARRKDAVTSYQSLLTKRIKDCEASWMESRPKLEKDLLGRATNSDLDQAKRERLFREYVNGLYERCVRVYRSLLADVITMDAATKHLEDGKNILTSWSEAKRLLKPDQRYARMPRRERELWWRRYAEDVQRRVKAIPSYTERRSIFEHYVRTRADEERKEKRAAQKAVVEGFKQLLDEASEDITYKTDYENFAKKWGDDHRFEALDRKERESLLNERVLPLRRALEEKVKAIQAASTASFKAMLRNRGDITSGSRWSKVKDSLRSDSRYKAVKREDREALFNEYVDEKRAAEQEAERAAKAKRDEEEKLKERKREMLKRKKLRGFLDNGRDEIPTYICTKCHLRYSAFDVMELLSEADDTFHCEKCDISLVAESAAVKKEDEADRLFFERVEEQLKPLTNQLALLKDLSPPDYLSLQAWEASHAVHVANESQGKTMPSIEEEKVLTAENSKGNDAANVKSLPPWMMKQGMNLTDEQHGEGKGDLEAEKATNSPQNDDAKNIETTLREEYIKAYQTELMKRYESQYSKVSAEDEDAPTERRVGQKPKRKASAKDFRKCIYHMRQAGEFSQGFLMACLPQRFEQRTRKFLDVEHLGYKRMSELVASCSDPVTRKWDIFKISASVRLGTMILMAMERMTGGRYSVVEKLGSGSFGKVYKGIDVETEENAAIKMERKDAKHPQLFHDSKIYEHIPEGMGIPNIRWRGKKIDHSILVLDLLGPSLGNIFGYRQCKFNLKMVLMLADQLIERIEYIYRRSVLHRDLKLDDLLMGISLTSKLVHLNDFGLSKLFQNSNSMRHIPLTTHKGLTRTVHYASINNHRGIKQSRRDDIESIGYGLLYFLRGNLPWQDVMDSNKKRKFENICEMKMATPIEYLCYEDDNVFEWTPMLKRHRLQNSRAGVPGPLPPVESKSSSPSVTPPPLPLEAFPLLKDINFPMTNDFKRYNDQFMMFRGRNILKSEAM